MTDSDNLDALFEQLTSTNAKTAATALDAIAKHKGTKATRLLVDYLRTAKISLLTTKAAMALERRKHASCLPGLREVYAERPELAEDLIPIFSELADGEAMPLIVDQFRPLMTSPARLSTLIYLVKYADPEAFAELLLPILFLDPIVGAEDDMLWALQQLLAENLEDDALKRVGKIAAEIGPHATRVVAPYMPPESELEKQAPRIARAFLDELVARELIEVEEDGIEPLSRLVADTILEANSPKALVRDVERVLLNAPTTEELYADRNDIRKVFEKVTR
ncbi:MAG: hypothetical protein VX223_08495 [Myxococcota bacterium]|nr:hypothetical protein [Myxococcota bacterium]